MTAALARAVDDSRESIPSVGGAPPLVTWHFDGIEYLVQHHLRMFEGSPIPLYPMDNDWVFASPTMKGKGPESSQHQ